MSGPITPEVRERILDLARQGVTRNQIARQLGVGAATVSKICREGGVTFDRTATKAATAAAVADARSRRARLMLDLLDDAARLRGQLWLPHTYRDHGGRDFIEAKWTQEEPTPADKRHLMLAASTAIGSSLKLDLHDSDNGAGEAKSLIGALAEGLGVAYRQLTADDDTPDDGTGADPD